MLHGQRLINLSAPRHYAKHELHGLIEKSQKKLAFCEEPVLHERARPYDACEQCDHVAILPHSTATPKGDRESSRNEGPAVAKNSRSGLFSFSWKAVVLSTNYPEGPRAPRRGSTFARPHNASQNPPSLLGTREEWSAFRRTTREVTTGMAIVHESSPPPHPRG